MFNLERNIFETTPYGIKAMGLGDKFLEQRIIFLDGEIVEGTGLEISKQLMYLDSVSHKPIKLYINSPGGSCTEGLNILNTMEIINSPVYTFNVGMAASMGFAILVRGDKRYSLKDAEAMAHQVSYGAYGNVQDVRIQAENAERMNNILGQKISEALNIPLTKYFQMTKRDKWLSPTEMLELGAIDKIILPKKNRKGKRNFTK